VSIFCQRHDGGDKMVLVVSEIPVQDANLRDLPESFLFFICSLFANS